MIWTIAKREIQDRITSSYFLVAFIFLLLSIGISAAIGAADYNRRLQNYHTNTNSQWERIKKSPGFTEVAGSPFIFYRKPNPLEVAVEGVNRQLADTYYHVITVSQIPALRSDYLINSLFSYFHNVDLAFIITTFLSLLAFLFSYDAINRENTEGTLRLIIANSVSRSQVIVGKLLGGFICLLLPLLIIALLEAVILLVRTPISPQELAPLAFIFLMAAVYGVFSYQLGVLSSTVIRSPSASLVFILFIWVLFFISLPNILALYAAEKSSAASSQVESTISSLRDKKYADLKNRLEELNATFKKTGDYAKLVEAYHQLYLGVISWNMEVLETYYIAKIRQQGKILEMASWLSPAACFNQAVTALAGTDLEGEIRYMRSVLNYIETKYAPHVLRMQLEEQKYAATEGNNAAEMKTLSLSGLPEFSYQPEDFRVRAARALPAVAILASYMLVLFALSYVSFIRLRIV